MFVVKGMNAGKVCDEVDEWGLQHYDEEPKLP
jgi:hypothetical protein